MSTNRPPRSLTDTTPSTATSPAPSYHLPVRPFSPIDALNRHAAALGSPRYAAATSYADNGHHVTVSWNSYRSYYVAEYSWAGRIVLARGDFATCLFATCLRAAISEYDRGALGASATIRPRAEDAEAFAALRAESRVMAGDLWVSVPGGVSEFSHGNWYTWRHQAAHEGARDMANPRAHVLIFDWDLMQSVESREAYESALRVKHGRVYQ